MSEAQAAKFAETAKAKVNLTLTVLGRRGDGYHQLESLVAFADVGDLLELVPGDDLALSIDAPFAASLEGPNLVIDAARAAMAAVPALRPGLFHLTKTLPIAAGLGGGSADAAAALRLLARANGDLLDAETMAALAAQLGSDVSVCLQARAALMTGRGETVNRLPGFPPCGVVLANPGRKLDTAKVFGSLKARPLAAQPGPPKAPDFADSFERLIDYASARSNDLLPAALELIPVIVEALDALTQLEGAALVRLSGSGPTCFALFATLNEAKREGAKLAAAHPNWWIASGALQ